MKSQTISTICVLLLSGSIALCAKEPQENAPELAPDDDVAAEAARVDALDRESAQRSYEEALQSADEATVHFHDALDALRASREHIAEISRVAPLVAASQHSVDSLGDDLSFVLRNRLAATTGFIGVQLGETTPQGIVIDAIVEGSPAEVSGLEVGDMVSSVDGTDIRTAKHPTKALTALIQSVDPGSEVDLKVQRDGGIITVPVTVGARGRSTQYSYTPPQNLNFPNTVSIFYSDRQLVLLEFEEELGHYFGVEYGILVVDAPEDGQLQVGDLLLRIDDKPVRSISHAERFLRSSAETSEFTVKRRGKTQKLDIASGGLYISNVREM